VQVSQRSAASLETKIKVLPLYGVKRLIVRCSIKTWRSNCGGNARTGDRPDRGSLKLEYVKWLVLDEADEMLSMGFLMM